MSIQELRKDKTFFINEIQFGRFILFPKKLCTFIKSNENKSIAQ